MSSVEDSGEPPPQLTGAAAEADGAHPARGGTSGREDYDDDDEDEEGDIVVSGMRQRGGVDTNIPPETQLNSTRIRALGVGSLDEVIEELAPQTRSLRGREEPVVLLDGQRISSFSEIRDLPPEAIHRIDVFPEEVALQYGYPAARRVVNVVLRRRYKAIGLQGKLALGGDRARTAYRGKANILRLTPENLFNLDLQYRHENAVFDRQDANPGATARTLAPESDQFTTNATLNRKLGAIAATINGRVQIERSRSHFGLSGASEEVGRTTHERTAAVGLTLNGEISAWRWSFTGAYDDQRESLHPFGDDTPAGTTIRGSVTNHRIGSADLLLNGGILSMPAGYVAASLGLRFESQELVVRVRSGTQMRPSRLGRETPHAFINFDIPLTSRREAFLGGLGELSANFNAQVDRPSGFGALAKFGYGLRWTPISMLNLIASMSHEEEAPDIKSLGAAEVITPSIRLYDFANGGAVTAARTEGGNPNLVPEHRRAIDLRLQLRPIDRLDLGLSLEYSDSRILHAISGTISATPQLERAFPELFLRDESGTLMGFDRRPVNFSRYDREQIRWGINFSRPLSPASRRNRLRQVSDTGEPVANGDTRSKRARRNHLQLSFYHTWHLREEVRTRPGLPVLDLLHGDAIRGRGGQPRHEWELQGGVQVNGVGVRVLGNWQSDTVVRDALPAEGGTGNALFFSRAPKVDLRLIVDLGAQPWLSSLPWLRGRLNLSVDNIFNARSRVTDANGARLAGLDRSSDDVLGRTIRLTLRKQFRSR
jgi:outer membrane receptor protein involved in Fe transport